MRAPFQILAIPYKKETEPLFCVFHRSDIDQWQFVAGGGEDNETALQAALREIKEESGINPENVISLKSMAFVPADVIAEKHRKMWDEGTFVIPEYSFAFECSGDIALSNEHTHFEWLDYKTALSRLTWDSNKTALYELNCILLKSGK